MPIFVKKFIIIKRIIEKFESNFYLRNNIWIFGEWFGENRGDNSSYLANYISDNHASISSYWVCNLGSNISTLSPKIKILTKDSKEAVKYLKKARIVVMSQGTLDFSTSGSNYFGNAITINLWHGVMWKKIGYDSENQKKPFYKLLKILRNYIYRADFYIAVSEEYKKHICTAFDVQEKNIIKAGLPRNSIFYNEKAIKNAREYIEKIILENFLPEISNTTEIKIIAYMPTFRDKKEDMRSLNNVEGSEKIEELLLRHNAIIIQKAHFINQGTARRNSQTASRIINLDDIDAMRLLAASDMLITDYSSCFFDYLLLDRPIIHYLYDYDYYRNEDRGLYYPKEEVVCGDAPETIEELITAIEDNFAHPDKYKDLRKQRREKFLTYEGPDSCKIITEFILDKIAEKERRKKRKQ